VDVAVPPAAREHAGYLSLSSEAFAGLVRKIKNSDVDL
jgi:hypothetical protein